MRIDSHWNRFISLRAAPDPLAMGFESLLTKTGSVCGFTDLVTLAFGSILLPFNLRPIYDMGAGYPTMRVKWERVM